MMSSPPPLPPPFDPTKNFQPLWRQAYQWLNQCHVLSAEAVRILSLPTSTIEDLATILTDGLFMIKEKKNKLLLCTIIDHFSST